MEWRSHLLQRQAESTRRGVGPACPSSKDTPVKGSCWLIFGFRPKKTYLVPLPLHPPGAAQDGEALGTQRVSANQNQDPAVAKVLDPSFQTQGLDKWSRTCSALVQEIMGSASCCPLQGRMCRLGDRSLNLVAPKQRVSLQRSATSFCLDETRYVCPLLQSWFLDTLTKSQF